MKDKIKFEILKQALEKINAYACNEYAQPRESNKDNNRFITIGKICCQALSDIRTPNAD